MSEAFRFSGKGISGREDMINKWINIRWVWQTKGYTMERMCGWINEGSRELKNTVCERQKWVSEEMDKRMTGKWINGWTNRGTNLRNIWQKNEGTDEWTNERMIKWRSERIYHQIKERTKERTNEQRNEQNNERTNDELANLNDNIQINLTKNNGLAGWMNIYINGGIDKWMNERMTKKRMNDKTNECMNKWMNDEWMNR